MPLAIVACFALGLVLSLLPKAPVPLAAFFLAVGLTCLTYSYLGGQLDKGNAGSGTIGILSFQLGGSIVTFLVSWLFLNHHLALSGKEALDKLSLQSGLDNIKVEAGTRQVGLLDGEELESWVLAMAEEDYFHPALILARRPFCSDNPGKCVLNAGFRAAAAKNTKVPRGSMKLCVIAKATGIIEEILQDPSLQPLLDNLEVVSAQTGSGDESMSLPIKGSYARGGSLGERCRSLALSTARNASPAIRIGALMNPADFDVLTKGQSQGAPGSAEVKVLFQ